MVMDRIDAQGTELFIKDPSKDMQAFWDRYVKAKNANDTLNKIFINEL